MYADRRLRVLFTVAMTLVVLAGVRSVWFAFAKADSLSVRAQSQQTSGREILAPRGQISDRNGVALAVSEPASDVSVSSKQVLELRTLNPPQEPSALAPLIADAFELDEQDVLAKLTSGQGFEYLKRTVPDRQVEQLRVAAREAGLRLTGLAFEPRNRRIYPNGPMAGQLLGAYGNDDTARGGLETALDDILRGTYGREKQTTAGSGSALRTVQERKMQPGQDVQLSLDSHIQALTEDVLGRLGEQFRPKNATAIVMRPDGAVLSMANWPRINPNDPNGSPEEAKQNFATGLTYEPGSTFKAVAVGGALQDRAVTSETTMSVPPQIQVADRVIKDAHDHGVETMTPGQILAQSSNVGTIKIGQQLTTKQGKGAFDGWMRKFGFGEPTGIGLPEEQGLLPKVEEYSGSTMGNLTDRSGPARHAAADRQRLRHDRERRHPPQADDPALDRRSAGQARGRHADHPHRGRVGAAADADRRLRGRRHRLRGPGPRLHAGRQDRDVERLRHRGRRVHRESQRGLGRRLRARQGPADRDRGRRQRARRGRLRRHRRRSGLRGDRPLRPAVPEGADRRMTPGGVPAAGIPTLHHG